MNIGLVLSGGMAKGALQLGALYALSECIPLEEIKYVTCASVGTLNGYAYMTNKLERAKKMWSELCNNDKKMGLTQFRMIQYLLNFIVLCLSYAPKISYIKIYLRWIKIKYRCI